MHRPSKCYTPSGLPTNVKVSRHSFLPRMNLLILRLSQTRRPELPACLVLTFLLCSRPSVSQDKIPNQMQNVLDTISANSLRGHLSFIASDLLEGRDSRSRGLDLAAEYIDAQFRCSGLEPAGGEAYFQTANWLVAEQDPQRFRLQLDFDGSKLDVGP